MQKISHTYVMPRRAFLRLVAAAAASALAAAVAPPPEADGAVSAAPGTPVPLATPVPPSKVVGTVAAAMSPRDRILQRVAQSRGTTVEKLRRLAAAPATSEASKWLKVALIPGLDIFRAEFGRDPLRRISVDPRTLDWRCGPNEDLGPIQVAGSDCDDLRTCGTYPCNYEVCGKLESCGTNPCTGQTRATNFRCTAQIELVSAETLTKLRNDPFVTALYNEFGVNTAGQLSSLLANALRATAVHVSDLDRTDLNRLRSVRPIRRDAAILKALLFPEWEFYQPAFGRDRPQRVIIDPSGMVSCAKEFSVLGDINITHQGSCEDNECLYQTCNTLTSCSRNDCTGQTCSGLKDCGTLTKIVSINAIEQMRADPFVKALMSVFGTTSSAALENHLTTLLRERRQLQVNVAATIEVTGH